MASPPPTGILPIGRGRDAAARYGLRANNEPSRWQLLYALELFAVDGEQAASRVLGLPVNPQGVSYRPLAAVEVTPTAGGVSVEESGFILTGIEVRGTFGLKARRGWGAGTLTAPGDFVFGDGLRLHEELVAFFELYDRIKRDPNANYQFMLAWHDFVSGRHYVVVPEGEGLVVDANAQEHRIHRPYAFRLKAVADYQSTRRNFFDDGIVADLRTGIGRAVEAVNMLTGYVEDARAFVTLLEAEITTPMRAAFTAVENLVFTATDLAAGAASLISAPFRFAFEVIDAVERWGGAIEARFGAGGWNAFDATLDRLLGVRELQQRTLDEVQVLAAQPDLWGEATKPGDEDFDANPDARVGADEAASGQPGLGRRASPGSATRRTTAQARDGRRPRTPDYRGQRRYAVREGDTLVAIAARELGSPDRWRAILEANPDLRAPYISGTGLPGTVAPGQVLMLPANDTEALGGGTRGARLGAEPDEAILGRDFELDEDGEWIPIEPGPATAVRRIGGVANWVQAVGRIKLRTRIGQNLLYPHLGLATPIGEVNGIAQVDAVALSARTVVAQDPRTADISELTVEDGGDRIDLVISARAKQQTGFRLLRQPVR